MAQQSEPDDFEAVSNQLQEMSERLEDDIAAAVRAVLEKSGYFKPASLDQLVTPVAGWASGLPFEAYDKGHILNLTKKFRGPYDPEILKKLHDRQRQ
jgi:hypothetical protein